MRRIAALLSAAVLLTAALIFPLRAAASSSYETKMVFDFHSGIMLQLPAEWRCSGELYSETGTTVIAPKYCCTLTGFGGNCRILTGSEKLSAVVKDKTDLQLKVFSTKDLSPYLSAAPSESIHRAGIYNFLVMQRTKNRAECYCVKNERIYMLDFQLDNELLTEEMRTEIITTTLNSAVLLHSTESTTSSLTGVLPKTKTTTKSSSPSSSSSSSPVGGFFVVVLIAIGIIFIVAIPTKRKSNDEYAAVTEGKKLPEKKIPAVPAKSQPVKQAPAKIESVQLVYHDYDMELPEKNTLLDLSLDLVADEPLATYYYVAEDEECGKYVAADSFIIDRPLVFPFNANHVAACLERNLPFDKTEYPDVRKIDMVNDWCRYVTYYFSKDKDQ